MLPRNNEKFIASSETGDLNTVKEYLESNQFTIDDINSKNSAGTTALISATKNGHKHIVETLVAFPGILINLTDKSGKTALKYANKNFPEIASILYPFKYDVAYAITNMGADCKLPQEQVNAILNAAYRNVHKPEIGKKAVDETGLTPLMKTVKLNNYFAALWLLESKDKKSKPDIDDTSPEKHTALSLAVSYKDTNEDARGEEAEKVLAQRNIIDLLVRHKASKDPFAIGFFSSTYSLSAVLCATGSGNLYFLKKHYSALEYFSYYKDNISEGYFTWSGNCLSLLSKLYALYLNIVTGGQLILEYWEDTISKVGPMASKYRKYDEYNRWQDRFIEYDFTRVMIDVINSRDIEMLDSVWKKMFPKPNNLSLHIKVIAAEVLTSPEKNTLEWLASNTPDVINETLKQAENLRWHREAKSNTQKLLKSLLKVLPSENLSRDAITSIKNIFNNAAQNNSIEIVKIILSRFVPLEGENFDLPNNIDIRIKNYYEAFKNVNPHNRENSFLLLKQVDKEDRNDIIERFINQKSFVEDIFTQIDSVPQNTPASAPENDCDGEKSSASVNETNGTTREGTICSSSIYLLFNKNTMPQAKIREHESNLKAALSSLNALANNHPEHKAEIEKIIGDAFTQQFPEKQNANPF